MHPRRRSQTAKLVAPLEGIAHARPCLHLRRSAITVSDIHSAACAGVRGSIRSPSLSLKRSIDAALVDQQERKAASHRDYRFFAPFFPDFAPPVGCAGCSLCSGNFAIVTIWICWLAGEVGCAWSMNCSSPSPSDATRFDEILKVLTSESRIASARRWLNSTLASRLPFDSV